ncbi:unnamed protein product [Brassica rapa subsp. narinosa]
MLRLFQRNDVDDGVEELPMEEGISMEGERKISDLSNTKPLSEKNRKGFLTSPVSFTGGEREIKNTARRNRR